MTDQDAGSTDLARMLALAEREQARTRQLLAPDSAVLYGAWGLAWLVGPGLMWLAAAHDLLPLGLAGGVFAALLVGAAVVTAVHLRRSTAGVIGVSSVTGAMYGWSWFAGFAALAVTMQAAARAGAGDDLLQLLWTALSCLVVGVLYMASGAMWRDATQFAIGVWILLVGAVGALFGVPANLLLMSLAGGGGFLLVAVLARLRRTA